MQVNDKYLAGFFDGEGTFYMGWQKAKHPNNLKMYRHATVLLSQSGDDGYELLNLIQQQYGGVIYKHLKAGQHKATKDAYKLYWNKNEATLLLEKLIPHLILKKKVAQEVYDYLTRE